MAISCLLTGAAGFLGGYFYRELQKQGKLVTVLDRIASGNNRWIQFDLAADKELRLEETYDEVYHLAGLAHIRPKTPADANRFYSTNRQGTDRLLRALKSTKAFVFISTVAVYGVERGSLLDEDTPRMAADPYGESKREAEDLVLRWGEQQGVRTTILRLPLVVGRGAPGNLSAMLDAIQRGRYFGISKGEARRSMVNAADVARIAPRAAQAGGIYHLTDGCHPSFRELEAGISKAVGKRVPRQIPRWAACSAARLGDAAGVFGIRLPLDTHILRKMTSTLTFSDARACAELRWRPRPVLDCLSELVSA